MEARRPRGPSVREAAARDLAGAGGQDAPIEIVQYDPEWPRRFASERERLLPLLMGAEIHHIGSTAVSGMPAKPVIDLMALVQELDAPISALVEQGGYRYPGGVQRHAEPQTLALPADGRASHAPPAPRR
jgi:GrpB-like predicted nucleotidyltransferase (UPF0157 family)